MYYIYVYVCVYIHTHTYIYLDVPLKSSMLRGPGPFLQIGNVENWPRPAVQEIVVAYVRFAFAVWLVIVC